MQSRDVGQVFTVEGTVEALKKSSSFVLSTPAHETRQDSVRKDVGRTIWVSAFRAGGLGLSRYRVRRFMCGSWVM